MRRVCVLFRALPSDRRRRVPCVLDDMRARRDTPFDSIESAHEYVRLLCEAVDESAQNTVEDLDAGGSDRQRDALRLVTYKLTQLRTHLTASSRILNDLRTLRRLLLHERGPSVTPRERDASADAASRRSAR